MMNFPTLVVSISKYSLDTCSGQMPRIEKESSIALWEGFSALYMDTSSGSGWGQPLSSSGSCLKNFEIQPVVECSTNPGCEVKRVELSALIFTCSSLMYRKIEGYRMK